MTCFIWLSCILVHFDLMICVKPITSFYLLSVLHLKEYILLYLFCILLKPMLQVWRWGDSLKEGLLCCRFCLVWYREPWLSYFDNVWWSRFFANERASSDDRRGITSDEWCFLYLLEAFFVPSVALQFNFGPQVRTLCEDLRVLGEQDLKHLSKYGTRNFLDFGVCIWKHVLDLLMGCKLFRLLSVSERVHDIFLISFAWISFDL